MVVGVADAVALARAVVEIAGAAAAAAAAAVGASAGVAAVAVGEFADVVVVEGLILDPNSNALAEGMLEALIAFANP